MRTLASLALIAGGVGSSRAVAAQHPAARLGGPHQMTPQAQGVSWHPLPPPHFNAGPQRRDLHPPRALEGAGDPLFAPPPPVGAPSNVEQRLKTHLLKDYDRTALNIYPFKDMQKPLPDDTGEVSEEAKHSRGIPVEVGINFHKVLGVDTVQSTMDLLVWLRFRWIDPRLAWDPEEWEGVDILWFWCETNTRFMSEIWKPDLMLWNAEESLVKSLTPTFLAVRPNGQVMWSRPGHLRPACKFEGLEDFPFDALGCTMEFGSWAHNGNYIRPVLMNGTGVSIGGSETAGEAYAEYTIKSAKAEEHVYPPFVSDSFGSGDWPVVFYHIVFSRAWEPYGRRYITLQITLNILAFCTFWLPPKAGGKAGLAITAMLAAVTAELVISAKLPSSSEITWFTVFSLGECRRSLGFAVGARDAHKMCTRSSPHLQFVTLTSSSLFLHLRINVLLCDRRDSIDGGPLFLLLWRRYLEAELCLVDGEEVAAAQAGKSRAASTAAHGRPSGQHSVRSTS